MVVAIVLAVAAMVAGYMVVTFFVKRWSSSSSSSSVASRSKSAPSTTGHASRHVRHSRRRSEEEALTHARAHHQDTERHSASAAKAESLSLSSSSVVASSSSTTTTPMKPLIKRGKTREHVHNLNTLAARKKTPDHSEESQELHHAAAAVLEQHKKKQEEEEREVPLPASHPIYCPPLVAPTEEHEQKILLLQHRLREVMIAFYDDPHTYARFLAARQWDLDRAEQMLRAAIEWRKSLPPVVPEYEDLVSLGLASELMTIMPGVDLFGRIICYMCPRRHNPRVRDVDLSLRSMIWFMDRLWSATRTTHYKKFVVLFNFRGFAMKNSDIPIVRAFLPVLQDYYPEVVGRIILVEYPMFIWGLWKIVRPLLDQNTQNKVQFIGPDELSEHFDRSTIPTEIGGDWEAPEPEVDLWDPQFDVHAYKKRPDEVIEEDGVYYIKKQ